MLGAVEAGGTKFVCAVGTSPGEILDELRFPTTDAGETLSRCVEFFRRMELKHGALRALGIGTFGPANVQASSPGYGQILQTPKSGWSGADFLAPLRAAFSIPMVFDTDVNAAALGEGRYGAARGLESFIYLTIGTGVGGGVYAEGNLLKGLQHPELGHIRVPRRADDADFPGVCPYHGDCIEGLASGPAIEAYYHCAASDLPSEHPAWDRQAEYLALALVNFICTLCPERIILGGGVMDQRQLFPLIRQKVGRLLNGYILPSEVAAELDRYIVPPELGNRAGITGALALAEMAVA